MRFDVYELTLGEWWASAIINGDYSGLSTDEEKSLNDFLEYVRNRYGNGHWDGYENSYYGRDEITGLYGAVCNVVYLIPKESE